MMLHCTRCDARAFLRDAGIVHRPACLRCGHPLPMPSEWGERAAGPMSPRPRPVHRPSPRPHA